MSDDNYKSSSPEAQLGGARRKNGHKASCSCHICENMKNKAKRGGYTEDAEKEMVKRMGGSNKKNGHKPNCGCPICKNMKNAKKKGGADEDVKEGGRKKKSNGHKANCKCPICKNMSKNKKGGQEEPDIENGLRGDIEEGGISAKTTSTMKKEETDKTSSKEVVAKDDEYDLLDAAEKGQAGPNMVGGTRKRRGSRKSNGHKANCGCPICGNMKHGRKTRRHRKRSHRRR